MRTQAKSHDNSKTYNISLLVVFISALVYSAFFLMKENDHVFNAKIGIWASVSVLVCTGLLQFKDGPFIRPHPSVWKVVLALAVFLKFDFRLHTRWVW